MEYVKKRLAEIRPYENNPRINDGAVDDVVESIRQCSYIAPIIVDEDGVILAWHTRYKALSRLGYEECDVVIAAGQRKLSAELADVDFCGYDFGQPVPAAPSDGEQDGGGPVVKTCPCCGEVFEA